MNRRHTRLRRAQPRRARSYGPLPCCARSLCDYPCCARPRRAGRGVGGGKVVEVVEEETAEGAQEEAVEEVW